MIKEVNNSENIFSPKVWLFSRSSQESFIRAKEVEFFFNLHFFFYRQQRKLYNFAKWAQPKYNQGKIKNREKKD